MIDEGGVSCPTNFLVGVQHFVLGTLHEGCLGIKLSPMVGSSSCCRSWNAC